MSKVQNLLAQRRFNVVEMMYERDPIAKQMLAAHIAQLDVDIERLRDIDIVQDWDNVATKEYPAHVQPAMSALQEMLVEPITQVMPIITNAEAAADLKLRRY